MSEAAGGVDPARPRDDVPAPVDVVRLEGLDDARQALAGEAASREAELSARWQAVLDGVMRGIAHAFSNRVATIGAAAYMLEHGDLDANEGAVTLRGEAERLDTLVQLLRQLPIRGDVASEPLAAADAVAAAVALHAHHFELREVACEVASTPDAPPVLAPPHRLVHALLLGLSGVKRVAAGDGRRVALAIAGDAERLRITMQPDGEPAEGPSPEVAKELDALRALGVLPPEPSGGGRAERVRELALDIAAAHARLAPLGGRVHAVGEDGLELTLPSLAAARHRERTLPA